jgi:hypothetical protein
MDAGTAVGISLGSVVVTLLISGVIAKLSPYRPEYSQGPLAGSIFDLSFINWFNVLYYFLPYGLFLFGVIYDGLIRKIKFFPAGFIGLAAVYLNNILSKLLGGDGIDTDICGIPGMSNAGSNIAPQNILFATTVLSYIASYISVNEPIGSSYAGTAWGGVGIAFVIGAIKYYSNSCYGDGSKWKGAFMSHVTPLLYALIGGILAGGGSGALIAKYVGNSSGIGIDSEQKQTLGGKGPAMAPTTDAPGAGKCSPTDSDDQFVCEAYKNGELVTSTIVE